MGSIYDLKPKFQNLLRPLVQHLAAKGNTANEVTVSAVVLSICYGLLLLAFPENTLVLFGFPVLLFIRMALNAIDGMLAREHGQKSVLGAYLNEVGDIVSDIVLYAPFIFFFLTAPLQGLLFVGFLLGTVVSEVVGILGAQYGNGRRYDGPMGKSDRAFAMGVFAVLLACFTLPGWLMGLITLTLLVGVWYSTVRRYQNAQKEGV